MSLLAPAVVQEHLSNVWQKPGEPFNVSATLESGQAFRWRKDVAGIWWGTVGKVAFAVWQAEGSPFSPVFWESFPVAGQTELFEDFFRLSLSLPTLYAEWESAEAEMDACIQSFCGLRVLRQDPVECFFGFQCASCNTVIKIERSVRKLAERYGQPILMPEWCPFGPVLYAFPEVESLTSADEATLRADLWGFRAPRVIALASILASEGEGVLHRLRSVPYMEAHAYLCSLQGIGAKVADCICLFCLDKDCAVPIDTHTRQIAVRLFSPDSSSRSLTPRVYAMMADAYRERFGLYAGWAQQYLFFGELRRAERFMDPKLD